MSMRPNSNNGCQILTAMGAAQISTVMLDFEETRPFGKSR